MNLLDQAYNQDNYINFLAEKFNFSKNLVPIEVESNDEVNTFKQLGTVTSQDGKKLPVFEIHIKPNTQLSRNRVQLRNLVAKKINTEDGALAVYVDDENNQWRFSFIAIEYRFTDDGIKPEQTASKRFTYLLGKNTQTRTAKKRFGKINKQSKLKDLEQAFAVEALSKEFYDKLYKWYEKAQTQVVFPNDEQAENHSQTSLIRLLTRLLFVWFLKEKKLINPDLFDENTLKTLIDYNEPSSFYKAILQNLFFATLNRPIMGRSFRTTTNGRPNKTNYLATNIYRYQSYFNGLEEDKIIALFDQAPFLNGGLFECLDREATDAEKQAYDNDKTIRPIGSAIRMEGFSDRDDNKLEFYNSLFFNGDENDLGLIDLFKQYQFTVEESTPLDVEIALDPELLGKVFENLLASYNPETGKEARKATGSFYTPREIVNYMVDESLKQYLIQAVPPDDGDNKFFQEHLTDLFTSSDKTGELDTDKGNLIYETETPLLIEAISSIKIIDPAVGSGAYPMGILQRLVALLAILDPDNKRWKEQKLAELPDLQSIEEDLKTSAKISDAKAKKKAQEILKDKEEDIICAFKNQDHNYLRKLYLIENCIYGVDIQPIAIQICKLRFFISLTIEQSPNKSKADNYGIKALPNLETKFIVANSLLPLGEMPKQRGIFDTGIEELQTKLAQVRHKHFSAKTLTTKRKYRDKDKDLREQMLEELTKSGITPAVEASMKRIVHWDLYNQNAIADWFDPKWMFGVDSFDIVIGNPPYIRHELIKEFKPQFEKSFSVFVGTADIYTYFYEKGVQLLNDNGHLCYITSNKWMRAKYGEKLRGFFKHQTQLKQIIDFEGQQVFENATVDTNILLCGKIANTQTTPPLSPSHTYSHPRHSRPHPRHSCPHPRHSCESRNPETNPPASFQYQKQLPDEYNPLFNMAIGDLSANAYTLQAPEILALKKKIEQIGTPLKDWDIRINYGIKTGFNEAFIINTAKRDELITQDPKSTEIIKPVLRGRDIKAYQHHWAGLWVILAKYQSNQYLEQEYPIIYNHLKQYKEKLKQRGQCRYGGKGNQGQHHWLELDNNPSDTYLAEFAKEKIVWQRVTKEPMFCQIKPDIFIQDSMAFITTNQSTEYLMAILNSKLIKLFVEMFVHKYGDTGYLLSNQYVEQLPIPQISKSEQQPFIALVDKILTAKQQKQDTTALETQIDQMVYGLYDLTDDEIRIIEDKR